MSGELQDKVSKELDGKPPVQANGLEEFQAILVAGFAYVVIYSYNTTATTTISDSGEERLHAHIKALWELIQSDPRVCVVYSLSEGEVEILRKITRSFSPPRPAIDSNIP